MTSPWFSVLALQGTASRKMYLLTGLLLFPIKYALDQLVALSFQRDWGPIRYLVWPDKESFFVYQLPPADRDFGLAMLACALPFIWIGVSFTLARLRDAGLSQALVLLFFVPMVNLILILWLSLAPSKPPAPVTENPWTQKARQAHERMIGGSDFAAFLLAVVGSSLLTAGLVFLSANVLASYGFGIFVGAPFALGWLAAFLYALPRKRTQAQCLLVGNVTMLVCGMLLLAFAFEGLICLIMAFPIAYVLVNLGAASAYFMQPGIWVSQSTPTMLLALALGLPALIGAESRLLPEPALREVETEILIDAPPERVWNYVISFPPLPEPGELIFRTGVAYPMHARIEGTGVGAVRHCVFSTGPFVEPITVWNEPRELSFDVIEQPEPMRELSPWDVHPPHLDNFLVSKKGRFLLEALPDGRTRLRGTTWYTNKMWPEVYWGFLADRVISSIHGRVLRHIKDLAESAP